MQNAIEGIPLSIQQKQIWPWQLINSARSAQCAILVEGEVDSGRLREVLGKVVQRHEILRTTFYRRPGLRFPLQVIAENGELSWSQLDLRSQGSDLEPEVLKELLRQERRSSFSLEQGPLLKAMLIDLPARRHFLICTLPSLCADSRTLLNLVQEISLLYDEELANANPDDIVQYIEFSEWQDNLTESEEALVGKEFWHEQDSSLTKTLSIPFENLSAAATAFEPEQLEVRLDQDLLERMDQASDYYTSPEVFLLACWMSLLKNLTSQQDVSVGYVINDRKYREFENAMGHFARPAPVSIRFESEMAFSEVLSRIDEAVRNSIQWQEYYTVEADSGSTFPTIDFEYIELPQPYRKKKISFTVYQLLSYFNRFKIRLICIRRGLELTCIIAFDPARFHRSYVRHIAACFTTLLRSAANEPFLELDKLTMLSEADRHELLVAFNNTSLDYPRDKSIHQLFELKAKEYPDRIAITCGEHQLSFAGLNAGSNQLARLLCRYGVRNESLVGICLGRSVDMIVGVLAIMKAGGAYIPLDPDYPKARLAYLLSEIQSHVLITQEETLENIPEFNGRTICIDKDRPIFRYELDSDLEIDLDHRQLCYVIYTSGSTGLPKGVAVNHQSLINYSSFICQRLAEPGNTLDVGLHFATVSTLSADLGNTCLFPSLISGGCLHILSYETATDSEQFRRYLSERGIDILKITPTHFSALISLEKDRVTLPARYLIFGGEKLTLDLVNRLAGINGQCRIINHYGPTETTVGVLTHIVPTVGMRESCSLAMPIGRPIANTEVYLLDDKLNPVPLGAAGELYLGGIGVARCYLQQAAHTAERFIPNSFNKGLGGRIYKTGDLARYLPDGNVEFIGRVDHQVKIRGYRIELGEIEQTLSRHPQMREVVVISRKGDEGRDQLVAYVVLVQETEPSSSELRGFLQERLPDYMIPSAIVILKSIPITANGKIDRQALPNPDEMRAEGERKFIAPRNRVEEALAEIWSQVLGTPKVSIEDNFFDLGGDSIMSILIVAKANPLGFMLSPKQLFEHQTIAELAKVAGAAKPVQAEQGPVIGSVALTPIQHWFFEETSTEMHHWNMALLFEVQQPIDPQILAKSLLELICHHDALRMRFVWAGSEWQQYCVAPGLPAPLTLINLSELNETHQRIAIESSAAQLQKSLNLTGGPILRLALFENGQGKKSRLLIIIHHLVVDAVSLRILLADLQTVYLQLSQGKPVSLPSKTTSLKQWSDRLREFVKSEDFQSDKNYWLSKEWVDALALPVDRSAGENTVSSSKNVTVTLEQSETRALLREVPKTYRTQIDEVLLAALTESIAWWKGDRRVLLDLEGHGREDMFDDIDISRTVGWFTTHYPVLLDLSGVFDPGDVLKRVKEQLRGIPNHGIGYGLLKYLRANKETIACLDLTPEIGFNYLGQVDQDLDEIGMLNSATENFGPLRSGRCTRSHLVDVVGAVISGRLRMTWNYSENIHQRATIEQVAAVFISSLKRMIAYCLADKSGGYTPSDFPHAGLSQEALDMFLTRS